MIPVFVSPKQVITNCREINRLFERALRWVTCMLKQKAIRRLADGFQLVYD
jgi:hypothetical protein